MEIDSDEEDNFCETWIEKNFVTDTEGRLEC